MMSNARRNRLAPRAVATAFAAALTLAGCATTFDALPEKLGGLPEGAPARPAEVAPYPNVYEPMAPRDVKKLTEGEQKSAEQELLALRESQNLRANPPPAASKKPAAPQQRKQAAKKAPGAKAAEKKAPQSTN